MTSSRLTIMTVATSAVLLLAACGQPADDAASSLLQPPQPIRVVSGSNAGSATEARVAGGDAAMSSMPAFAGYSFELGPDFPALPTGSTGYHYPANPALEPDVVAQLAQALGVEGEPVPGGGPTVDGVRWRVGPDDGSAPSLTVSDDAQLNFNYSPAWDLSATSVGCAEPVSSDGTVSEASCPEPVPPVNVPSADEAEQLVTDLLVELGQDPSAFELEAYADEYFASVTAWSALDGLRSPMAWGFGYGENGELQWMNGVLATPVAVGPYPLIGIDEALVRLDEQTIQFRGGVFLDDMATTGGAEVGVGQTTPVEASTGAPVEVPTEAPTDPAVPSETIPAPGDKPVEIAPIETIPPEQMLATLVDVKADLWWAFDDDGSVWLLPAYSFSTSDGGIFTVPAVTDEFLVIVEPPVVEPLPAPLPVPGDPSAEPPVSVVDADTSGVEGLGVPEATAVLEARGLTLRVVREDGVDLAVTEDFSTSRVNVAVDAGIVTAVISVG
jgi:hypothetical protein